MAEEQDWLRDAAAAAALGDQLGAIDLARRGLEEHPHSLALEYAQLLGFSRAGAGRQAASRLAALREGGRLEGIASVDLRRDFAALGARLLKDAAVTAGPEAQPAAAGRAAAAYEAVYRAHGGSYPAINAATLWRIAGEFERMAAMVAATLRDVAGETPSYWRFATLAEALLLRGDEAGAIAAAREALALAAGRLDDIASTRRQIAWLVAHAGTGQAVLAAFAAPLVVHFLPVSTARDTISGIAGVIDAAGGARNGLLAYGAICAVSDLATASALLELGATLELVLPCAAAICGQHLATQGGEAAGGLFDRVLAAAGRVSEVTAEGDPEEATVLGLARIQARGHAMLRAAHLAAPMWALAGSASGAVLRAPAQDDLDARRRDGMTAVIGRAKTGIWAGRQARALVFGDVKGFSALSEAQHPAFLACVVGGFADALAGLGASVAYAETAGDGLYVVLTDLTDAVAACHALHRVMGHARLREAGLPPGLALRLSAHLGPVFHGLDRVTGREKFFGKEVIRTARIEPIAPPGETYVTEAFAAALCCATGGGYECEYVGRQEMAKGFGACRMYSLRGREAVRPASGEAGEVFMR